jgi:hypothetical protein
LTQLHCCKAADIAEDDTFPDLLVVCVSCFGVFCGIGLAYGFFLFLVAIDVNPLIQAFMLIGVLFLIALAGPLSITISRTFCKE